MIIMNKLYSFSACLCFVLLTSTMFILLWWPDGHGFLNGVVVTMWVFPETMYHYAHRVIGLKGEINSEGSTQEIKKTTMDCETRTLRFRVVM